MVDARERALLGVAALTVALALAAAGRSDAREAGAPRACPASFATASASATTECAPTATTCSYPEGRCTCAAPSPCRGVPQPPERPRWICRAKRTDGCPESAPARNGACARPGKTCSYGDCGSLTYTCAATKKWAITGGTAPPPGAPGGGSRTAPDWKQCQPGQHFGCQPRSQGIAPAPGETIPAVCGCIPRCPPPQPVLVSFQAEGRWPDGSLEGRFQCATGGIPSAAPPRGP